MSASGPAEAPSLRLFKLLRSAGLTAAFAESCTGGLCAAALTAIPGSSEVFLGGVVSYSNESKRELLGVADSTLARHGAVSAEVVREMASGVLGRFGADCALAVSGIAGPDGGTAEKPVGTVWIGARFRTAACERHYRFDGDRDAVRNAARDTALVQLATLLSSGHATKRYGSDQA